MTKPAPVVHIVGAGVAGLAAAVRATEAGARVRLYEAAPQAGGRCRTVRRAGSFTHDNGTHVLLGANPRALDLLGRIGARDRWIEPEPSGLPVFDLRNGDLRHIGLAPSAWLRADRRPEGFAIRDIPRLVRLLAPLRDRPIGQIFAGSAILDSFVDPMTVAVLNTPVETASARRLGRALRRVLLPGGGRLFVARDGLGPDLVEPALAWLGERGVEIRTGARLKAVEAREGRATALVFAGERITLGEQDRVVLALPPPEIGRLFPAIAVPDAFEPIVNAHFAVAPEAGAQLPRFIGMRGALSQWLLVRADHVSVTVSAAGSSVDSDPDALSARIWNEIEPAMRAAGLDMRRTGEGRVVKEKRATIRQAAGDASPSPVSPCVNLALAGDWISDLPATIESATISGEDAAMSLLGGKRR